MSKTLKSEANLGVTSGYNVAYKQLTSGQIGSLNTTPIEIVPAPAAGTFHVIIAAGAFLDFNSVAYTGTDTLDLQYATTNTVIASLDNLVTAANDEAGQFTHAGAAGALASSVNEAIEILGGADFGAGNSVIDVWVIYLTLDTN